MASPFVSFCLSLFLPLCSLLLASLSLPSLSLYLAFPVCVVALFSLSSCISRLRCIVIHFPLLCISFSRLVISYHCLVMSPSFPLTPPSFPRHFLGMPASFYVYVPFTASRFPTSPFVSLDFLVSVFRFPLFPFLPPFLSLRFSFLSLHFPFSSPSFPFHFPLISC